jgi:hypothetical protein
MHDETRSRYQSEMSVLATEIEALPAQHRATVFRLLRLDVDLLSVAALTATLVEDALRQYKSPMLERAECVRALLAQSIRMKVEALGPFALDKGIEKGAGE